MPKNCASVGVGIIIQPTSEISDSLISIGCAHSVNAIQIIFNRRRVPYDGHVIYSRVRITAGRRAHECHEAHQSSFDSRHTGNGNLQVLARENDARTPRVFCELHRRLSFHRREQLHRALLAKGVGKTARISRPSALLLTTPF